MKLVRKHFLDAMKILAGATSLTLGAPTAARADEDAPKAPKHVSPRFIKGPKAKPAHENGGRPAPAAEKGGPRHIKIGHRPAGEDGGVKRGAPGRPIPHGLVKGGRPSGPVVHKGGRPSSIHTMGRPKAGGPAGEAGGRPPASEGPAAEK